MTTDTVDQAKGGRWARISAVFLRELRAAIPPTVLFFFGFNLILFTKRLFLADYLIANAGFFFATTAAPIVGKVVLVAEKMPFLRRFDNEPLIYPILFKASSIRRSSLSHGSSRYGSIT